MTVPRSERLVISSHLLGNQIRAFRTADNAAVSFMRPMDARPDSAYSFGLQIKENLRGHGLARPLFQAVVKQAQKERYSYLVALVANERTAKLRDQFPSEDVSISRFNESGDLELTDMTVSDAVEHLRAVRQSDPFSRRGDEQLHNEHDWLQMSVKIS